MEVRLIHQAGKKRTVFRLQGAESVIGRAHGCAVRIPSSDVSRTHCRLAIEGDTLTVDGCQTPARITALSYALMGSFEDALHCWRKRVGVWSDINSGPLLASGFGAMHMQICEKLLHFRLLVNFLLTVLKKIGQA